MDAGGAHALDLLLGGLVLALRGAHQMTEQQRIGERPDPARDRA